MHNRDNTRTAAARATSINRRQSAAAKRTAQTVRFTRAGRTR